MSSNDQAQGSAFEPQMVAIINQAYGNALARLAREGAGHRRMEVAKHLLALARNGEADAGRLCERSVLAVLGRRTQPGAGPQSGPAALTGPHRAPAEHRH